MSSLPVLEVQGGPALRGNVSVEFECSLDWHQDTADQLAIALNAFVIAGALGGYRAVAPGTKKSTLGLAGAPEWRGASLRAELVADNVDARAFQYLRHLASRIDLGEAAIRRIVVREHEASLRQAAIVGYPVIDDHNEEDFYPEPIEPQPFRVVRSEQESEKTRRLEIELSRSVAEEDISKVAVIGRAWGALLDNGAFALPFGLPDEVDSFMGEVTQFDEYAIEIDVAVYQATEAGWDVLLNMLASAAANWLPIVAVTIE